MKSIVIALALVTLPVFATTRPYKAVYVQTSIVDQCPSSIEMDPAWMGNGIFLNQVSGPFEGAKVVPVYQTPNSYVYWVTGESNQKQVELTFDDAASFTLNVFLLNGVGAQVSDPSNCIDGKYESKGKAD